MGIISKLIRHTPFYKFYASFNQRRNEKAQKKLEEEYFPARVEFYKSFINENDLVFDVGANVGNRVEAFIACNAKVVAVEPQPSCVDILKQKFQNRINIENIGLSETPGELEMHISTDSTISSFSKDYIENTKDRFKYSQYTGSIKVPVSTLDLLIDKYGTPRFCKIDVEGFELNVLKGLHKQVPYLSLEYCVPELKQNLVECLTYVHQLSPSAQFNYGVGESMTWALPEWMSFHEFLQHIDGSSFAQSDFGDVYIKNVSEA
jgi:FkbM family methyltransferase